MMTETELHQRQAVVHEALSWLRTPYHHGQRLKGAGVDCALFLAEVYHNAGLIPEVEFDYYPHDWHMHRNDERYLRAVLEHGRKVETDEPLPGDVAMYQYGRCTAHGAIVIAWPQIIHAQLNESVTLCEAFNSALQKCFRGIYRYKGWE